MNSIKPASPRIWMSLLSLMWMWFAAGAATGDDAEWHYYYFKERRPLSIDAGRVALHFAESAETESLARSLSAASVDARALEPLSAPRWFLAPAADSSSAQELRQLSAAVKDGDSMPVDFISPVIQGRDGAPIILTREILVGFERPGDPAANESVLRQYGEILERDWANMEGVYRLKAAVDDGLSALDIANRLAEREDTVFAEPDAIFTGRGEFAPNDPLFVNQWGLHNFGQKGGPGGIDLDCPEAWDVTLGSGQIGIAILDTGVQQNHPDINQFAGADVTSQGPGDGGPVNPFDNHGTLVAGIVSGIANNGVGIAGVAPNCVSLSVRTFIGADNQAGWTSQSSWTVNALAWAEAAGARVTLNSNSYDPTLASSAINLKYAQTRMNGMVHFAASGDQGFPTLAYPASLPTVNAVGALDVNGLLAPFSNYGDGLDFVGPGAQVFTTDRTGADGLSPADYDYFNGTSLAAAHAAGAAALVLSQNPLFTAAEVEQRMQQAARDFGAPGVDPLFGWGLPNANDALRVSGIPVLGTPRIHPAQGAYQSPLSIMIDSFIDGAEVHYTTNGSDPRRTSPLYIGPFTLYGAPGAQFTVKAKAFMRGAVSSPTATEMYTISSVPTGNIKVLSPNGGEAWGRGSCQAIQWQHQSANATVTIALYKGGVFHSYIKSNAPGTGIYYWTVPTAVFTGNDYQVRVIDGGNASNADSSDGNFTINDDPSFIQVEYPNGGEFIQRDTFVPIRWSSDGASDRVRIDLYRNGYYRESLAVNAPNSGAFMWFIPMSTPVTGSYRILISDEIDQDRRDFSDTGFFIAPPIITIIDEFEGETLPAGSNNWVRWTSEDVGMAVNVRLLLDGQLHSTLKAPSFNSGSYLWSMDEDVAPGPGYQIEVIDDANPDVRDVSGEFNIGPPGDTDVNAAPAAIWMRMK